MTQVSPVPIEAPNPETQPPKAKKPERAGKGSGRFARLLESRNEKREEQIVAIASAIHADILEVGFRT